MPELDVGELAQAVRHIGRRLDRKSARFRMHLRVATLHLLLHVACSRCTLHAVTSCRAVTTSIERCIAVMRVHRCVTLGAHMRLEVLGPRTLRVRAHFGRQLFEPCAYACMCVRACVQACAYMYILVASAAAVRALQIWWHSRPVGMLTVRRGGSTRLGSTRLVLDLWVRNIGATVEYA